MVNRVSNDQLDELLEFLAEHPTLARGVGFGSRSKETVERQWNDLARKLNSFGSGSSKTGDRWKKYWFDLKHKSKTRLAKWRRDARGAGGGLSNQEDISEIDKKILAIIGEQAVFGESQHRVPLVNVQPQVQVTAIVQPDNIVVSEEVVISGTSEFPEPVPDSEGVQTQQVPEQHQTGLESPVSQPQPARLRPRPRHNRTGLNFNSTTFSPTRIDPQWVKELERNRVQAENKMAAATLMIAEAANKIAEASLMNAEANLMNAKTNRMNAETNRMNAETNRKQLEVMKASMDVVGQTGQPSSARVRAEDSPQSENQITVFCPKCNTEVSHPTVPQTLKEAEGRNADKRQEPPEKRRRARKRSRQTDSSSEEGSSDDNVDDNEQSSNSHDEEPEIVIGPAAVKVEPSDIEVNKEQTQTDPISLDVKTELLGDEVENTNVTLTRNEPAETKHKGRKMPRRRDVTSTRQHTQGESSTPATVSSVRLTEELDESSVFGETEVKTEEIEIREEGFS